MSTTDRNGIDEAGACLERREFLLFAGATTVGIGALGINPVPGLAHGSVAARVKDYPRQRLASLSELALDEPRYFLYPWDHPNCRGMIVRTGRPCGGGIGPGQDVVAFNVLCTHQGGLLEGLYDSEYKVAGPCPLHLTTFDLTRYGMVVAGHATEGLPQIRLELDGDDVFAVGVQGLVYGYANNREGA